MNQNKNPLIFKIGIFVALLAVGITFWILGNSSPSNKDEEDIKEPNIITGQVVDTGINLRIVPTYDSTITVNGKKVREGAVELKAGTYEIKVSHAGFETQSRTVTLADGDSVSMGIVLLSNSAETADYYNNNETEARKAEGIAGQKSEAVGVSRVNKLPLIKKLPQTERGRYKITYGQSVAKPNDPSAVALFIDYIDEASKKSALNWITYQGYDTSSIEIIYRAVKSVENN
jgi:hypothetical protein